MPPRTKTAKTALIIAAIVLVAAGAAAYYLRFDDREGSFCYNFVRDIQYGDRVVENPVNIGFRAPNGMMYYAEVVPLQTALQEEGLYVDPYEVTGGGVYYGAFFGPSTQVAVRDFQKKYGFAETGEVNASTTDKLRELYGCPIEAATSTAPVATSTE